jgi:hypothetical protein
MRVIELDNINDVTIAMKIRKENLNQSDFDRSEYRTFERFTTVVVRKRLLLCLNLIVLELQKCD